MRIWMNSEPNNWREFRRKPDSKLADNMQSWSTNKIGVFSPLCDLSTAEQESIPLAGYNIPWKGWQTRMSRESSRSENISKWRLRTAFKKLHPKSHKMWLKTTFTGFFRKKIDWAKWLYQRKPTKKQTEISIENWVLECEKTRRLNAPWLGNEEVIIYEKISNKLCHGRN